MYRCDYRYGHWSGSLQSLTQFNGHGVGYRLFSTDSLPFFTSCYNLVLTMPTRTHSNSIWFEYRSITKYWFYDGLA